MVEQTAAEKARALLEAMKAKKAAAQATPVTAQAEVPAPSPPPFIDMETTAVTEPAGKIPPLPVRFVTPPPKTPDNTADLEDPDTNDAFNGAMLPRVRALRDAAMAEEEGRSPLHAADSIPAKPRGVQDTSLERDVDEDAILEEETDDETPHASPFTRPSEDDFSDVAADSDELIDLGLLADDSVDDALRAAVPERAERFTGPIEVGVPDALLAPESAAVDAIAEAIDQVDTSRAFSFDGIGSAVEVESEPEAPVQSSNILPILAKARAGTLLDAEEALHALRVLTVGYATAQQIRDSPAEVDTSMGTNAAALLASETLFLPNVRMILSQSPESVLHQIEADAAENWNPIREALRTVAQERGFDVSKAADAPALHALLGEPLTPVDEGVSPQQRTAMPRLDLLGTPRPASSRDSDSLASQLVSALPVLAPQPRDGATSTRSSARVTPPDSVPGRMPAHTVDNREHPQPFAPRAPRVSSPAPSVSGSGDGLTPAARATLDELDREAALRNSANAAAHRADVAASHPANHDAGRDHARAEVLRALAAVGGRGPATPVSEEPQYLAPSISAYSVDSFLHAVNNNPNPRGSNNSTRYEREVYHHFSQYPRVVAEIQRHADTRQQWQRIESAATVYWTTFYRNELIECTSLEAVRDHEPSSPNPAKLKAFEAARKDLFMQVVLETSNTLNTTPEERYPSVLDTLRTVWGIEVVDLLVTTTSDLAGQKPEWLSLALERASDDVRARIGPTLTPLDRTPTPWTVEMVFDQITRNPHAPGSEDFAKYDFELYETVTREAPGIVPQVQNHLRGVLWGRLEVAHAMWTLEQGPTTATVAPSAEMIAAGRIEPATTPKEAIARGRSRNIDSNWTIEGYREAVRAINRLPEDMLARGHVLLYDTIVAESRGAIDTLETHTGTRVLWKVTTSTYERDGPSILADMMNTMGSNEERVAFFISRFMGTTLQRDAVNRVPVICEDNDWITEFNVRVSEELPRALQARQEVMSLVEGPQAPAQVPSAPAPAPRPTPSEGLDGALAGLTSILAGVPPSRPILVTGLLAFFKGATPNEDTEDSRAVVAALDAIERMGDGERRYYSQNTPNVSSAQSLKAELATCNDVKVTQGATWSDLIERFNTGATGRGFSTSRTEQEVLQQARRMDISDLRAKLGRVKA